MEWMDRLIVTTSERDLNTLTNHHDRTVEVRDLSGAGDSWMAGFVVKYLETKDPYESIEFANEKATIVVQKRGVTTI